MAAWGILTYDAVKSGVRNTIQAARIRRTQWLFQDRPAFMRALVRDIHKAIRRAKAKGFVPVFRLNGTSDIRWEGIGVSGEHDGIAYSAPNVMALFPLVQFYDYTKLPNRKRVPANYHLTFSLADGNDDKAREALANGVNVAAVFRNKATVSRYIDAGYMSHPVFCGDDSDLRFLDPARHVIALYAKGNAKRDNAGFVRD
jgi:hypothetical protein